MNGDLVFVGNWEENLGDNSETEKKRKKIMKKKVIVIGAGVAGLSSGIYAQKCGFDVTILESHSIAGGNCTSWKRKGYLAG